MRLMIVGSDKVYAIENFYTRYLAEMDLELLHFPAQSIFYDYYDQGILYKLLYKSGLSRILHSVNRQFREKVISFKPDIIWIFKGMEIFPSSLQWAKERNIRLVNYNPDNPFIFSGKGSGNRYITDSLPLYDLHMTYNLQVKRTLEETLHCKTAVLPFGFDLSNELYERCQHEEEINRVCFLGNPDAPRAAFIRELAAAGIPIDVFGNGWKDFVDGQPINVFAPVYAEEFWKTLRRYRIQLNLMRIHNEDSHNMRSFEVPGVGGIMLAPSTTEHRLYFNDGQEAFLFHDLINCVTLAGKILQMETGQAALIRANARGRSLNDGYSYKDRASMVLEQFRILCGN